MASKIKEELMRQRAEKNASEPLDIMPKPRRKRGVSRLKIAVHGGTPPRPRRESPIKKERLRQAEAEARRKAEEEAEAGLK